MYFAGEHIKYEDMSVYRALNTWGEFVFYF